MARFFFFLIPLLFLGIIFNPAFAEIQKTQFGDHELLSFNPDGTQNIKFTSKPERVLIDDSWVDFRFLQNDNYLTVETGHGTIRLSKNFCNFEFYKKGVLSGVSLFTDSIVAKMANNGTNNWTEINSITNANCETYGNENQLVAKKYVENVGFIEYKYLNINGKWKTQLEATNLSSNTNKKFGFSQTIDINKDTVIFGNQTINLDNFNGTTFDRNWILNHDAKIVNFLNGIYFDHDLGLANLDSIYVLDTGNNKSKITFNYLYDQQILLPNEKRTVDPTFSATPTSENSLEASDATPANCNGKTYSALYGNVRITYDASICRIPFFSWNTSTIPASSTVTSASLTYDVITATTVTGNCYPFDFTTNPTGSQGDYDAVFSASGMATPTNGCTTLGTNKVFTMNATGISKIQSNISGNEGFVAIGVWFVTEPTLTEAAFFQTSDATLEIVYQAGSRPFAVTDLTTTSISQTQICYDWSQPYLGGGNQFLLGYQINITTPYTNNPLVYVNDTGTSTSSYCATPLTLNTAYSARISAWTNNTGGHPFNNATGNVYNATTTNFNPPGAPTLSASALSDTSIRFTSIRGSAGDNSTIWYSFQCELNQAGSWSTVVSNSSLPSPSIYEYTGLTLGDELICQWRDGSVDGWSPYSNNATDILELAILSDQRTDAREDRLLALFNWVDSMGGVYFGLGALPFGIMLLGFMAGKKTVRIFTLVVLFAMGIIHGSGYYVFPNWYWTLSLLFGIVLVLGRHKSD